MAEPAPTGHRRAALFVDFENVYPGLCAASREAGRRFATDPARWVRWMEQSMGPMLVDADDAPRVLLRRICYLDPGRSSRFRPYFTRAGFRIVDCPALTAAGKNSADIYMVLDILDTLRHPTYFEEFIVLSVDADFTPVLLRLREHDRRTAMLVSGPTAAAMQAACDFAIPDALFLDEALGLGVAGGVGGAGGRWDEGEQLITSPETPGERPNGAPAIRERMERVVRAVVGRATEPVPMAVAAHEVRRSVGSDVAATQWGGCGTFGRLVAGFADATLRVDTSRAPGYLYDPTRHAPPETDEPGGTRPEGVPEVAERVHRVVGAPLLAPEGYRRLFEVLVKDARVAAEDGQASAERATRDACARLGQPIPRSAVHFVLLGFRYSGVDWTDQERDAGSLANAFASNVLRLAADAQMDLGEAEQSQIRTWIAGVP